MHDTSDCTKRMNEVAETNFGDQSVEVRESRSSPLTKVEIPLINRIFCEAIRTDF